MTHWHSCCCSKVVAVCPGSTECNQQGRDVIAGDVIDQQWAFSVTVTDCTIGLSFVAVQGDLNPCSWNSNDVGGSTSVSLSGSDCGNEAIQQLLIDDLEITVFCTLIEEDFPNGPLAPHWIIGMNGYPNPWSGGFDAMFYLHRATTSDELPPIATYDDQELCVFGAPTCNVLVDAGQAQVTS